jgi:hypothetical protein
VGACAGQSSPRAAAAALPSDREYIENRPNEIASILGTVPEHLSLEKKALPGRVFIPRCAQDLKKCILRQNWPCSVIVRAGRAFFLRFEPLYHTSEHMRCMVWVGSAVVTPAQGPQAANAVKLAKYYVGEG